MSPNSSRASVQLLASVLLAAHIANAAVVPHQVLDARAAAPQATGLPTTSDIAAALEVVAEEALVADDGRSNVFDDIEEGFRSRTGLDVLRDFFSRLFGWENDDSPSGTITVTVSVTPSAAATSSEAMATSSDEPATTTEDVITPPEMTPEPTENPIMSILPIGNMTSMINVTLPDPMFSSELPLPEETTVDAEPTETAIVVTDSFTAVLPTTTVISDEFLGTITLSDDVTSVIMITATLDGTGVSVGTGVPIIDTAAPFFPNTTFAIPTEIPAIVTEIPGTTIDVPVVVVNATSEPTPIVEVTLPVGIPVFTDAPVESEVPAMDSTSTITTTIDAGDLLTEIPVPTEFPAELPIVNATEVPVVSFTEIPVVDPTEIGVVPTIIAVDPTEIPVVDPTEIAIVPTEIPIIDEGLPTIIPVVVDPTSEVGEIILPTPAPVVDPIDNILDFPGQF